MARTVRLGTKAKVVARVAVELEMVKTEVRLVVRAVAVARAATAGCTPRAARAATVDTDKMAATTAERRGESTAARTAVREKMVGSTAVWATWAVHVAEAACWVAMQVDLLETLQSPG